MREQFEKLPEIAKHLASGEIHYHEIDGVGIYRYLGLDENMVFKTLFVYGAWYAYQEQQKRINELEALLYGELK